MSQSPHYSDYKCTKCGKITLRDILVVKSVVFKNMGAGANTLKSTTTEWLCDECLELDEDYQRPPFRSPGMKSTPLERVRAAEAKVRKK